jgi:FixJ family two-component response regulator
LPKKSRSTVIVIDDDASMRRALSSQLQILGFEVLVLESATELLAMELLTSEFATRDACLLVDVYMPEISGLELCGRLAAAQSRMPIVMMSGRDDAQTRLVMREAHSIANLFKPFDERTLLRAIRKALRNRSGSRPSNP